LPRYAAIIYRVEPDTPGQGGQMTEETTAIDAAWAAFNRAVREAGVLKMGNPLKPSSTATVVRVSDGKTVTTDGPFAETREQLGGMLVFECADLDEAILWASRIPDASSGGCIEVRPLWEW
jgi:hypothetical protein